MPTPPKKRTSTRARRTPDRYRESPPREAKKPRVSAGEDISACHAERALERTHGRTCLYVYMYINIMYNIYSYLYAYEYILYTLIYLLYNSCRVLRSPEWTVSTVKTSPWCSLRLSCQAPPCNLLYVQGRRPLRLVHMGFLQGQAWSSAGKCGPFLRHNLRPCRRPQPYCGAVPWQVLHFDPHEIH